MEEIVAGLNPEQRAAVEHAAGPLLVVAGAGTGKTQVITRRIAYLIRSGRAKPGQVLALTFTEKAAREMEERLYGLIGWESFQVPVMTFHAFGTELLGRFASHVGRSVRGGLLNDTQKTLLLQQHISSIKLGYYGPQSDTFEFLEGIVRYIGGLQNAGVDVAAYEAYVNKLKAEPGDLHPRDIEEQSDLAKLYRLYEEVKQQSGTFDFNDQLQVPLQILEERPNLAQRLADEYRYVLVDEYQDTNWIQDKLLRTFLGQDGNIFAVGDDDQAIYGFRGADVGNILQFTEHYQLKEAVVLTQNYRSGQAILDGAYSLIRHNDPERLEFKLGINKRLKAQHNDSRVEFVAYKTPADEQAGVLAGIEKRLKNGEKASDMAVLASTHAQLKALAKAMRSKGLRFALSTVTNIFDQPELIGLWHLLRWLVWQADEPTVGHVIMGPYIGWSTEQYRRLLELSHEGLITTEEALVTQDSEKAQELVACLEEWRGWARELPVSQLVFKLVFETGMAEKWRHQGEDDGRIIRVFEDLQRLLEQMQDFETVVIDSTLLEYTKAFPKPPVLEVSEPLGEEDGVQLLTVHASKGLEFETVYLVGCTRRNWSGGRSSGLAVPDELKSGAILPPEHELRRLMYVAATRAKKDLLVSAASSTMGGAKQAMSSFVTELLGDKVVTAEPLQLTSGTIGEVMQRIQQFYPLATRADEQRLPFESSDGWLELSVTDLGKYEFCPFEFYIENVLQIRHPFGPQLAFGNILHRVFELYYKDQLAGREPAEVELRGVLDELWSDRGYQSREAAEADRGLAHQTLAGFVAREVKTSRRIVASEFPVRFELPEARLRLRGKIDALFEGPDGTELRDFKTGRTKTDADKLSKEAKDNFQLRSYALAHEMLNGAAPQTVTLDYVVTGVEGVAELSPTILRNHRAKLQAIAEQIRRREFAPNPSPVHVCAAIRYYGTGEQDEMLERALMAEQEGTVG